MPRHSLTRLSRHTDRKSTRLNSSHLVISYAVFCLKKNRLPSALEGRQSRERPICATHGLNALTSGKYRMAGPGERLEFQSFLATSGTQRPPCPFPTFRVARPSGCPSFHVLLRE